MQSRDSTVHHIPTGVGYRLSSAPHTSPSSTPAQSGRRRSSTGQQKLTPLEAARIIERAWLSHRDKKIFLLLKTIICSAESSLSSEIIRKMVPNEADFFNSDRAARLKVKFRFGGEEFPPNICYKIFLDGAMYRPTYLHGKKFISPHDKTASQACSQMGQRVYYEQLVRDWALMCSRGYQDHISITNVRDYMQYVNTMDELPVSFGGRGNTWRRLNGKDFPRGSLLVDVMEYLYASRHPISERLRQHLPVLQQRCPNNRALLERQAQLLMQVTTIPHRCHSVEETRKFLGMAEASERSLKKKSQLRVERMRELYTAGSCLSPTTAPVAESSRSMTTQQHQVPSDLLGQYGDSDRAMNEDWEQDAANLYQWSQRLSNKEMDDSMFKPHDYY